MHITSRDRDVAAFIKSYSNKNKKPPLLKEVADFMGVKVTSISRNLKRLRDAGVISRTKTSGHRSYYITDAS
jgi:Mn-dependent DtxR family transcriptional regulator